MIWKVVLPDSPFRQAWNYMILLATVWYALTIPLFLVPQIRVPEWSFGVDVALTLVFLFDILLNFRTAIMVDGELTTQPEVIRAHYLRGFFALDLVATIPWDMLFLLLGNMHIAVSLVSVRWLRFLRLPRMLRIFRLPHLLRVKGTALPPRQSERIFGMIFWIMTLTSWCACLWMMLIEMPKGEDTLTFIIKAYYWTVTTMASVGYGDITPTTNAARIFSMFVMMLGVAMYAFIIGQISTMIVNVNVYRKRNMDKIEQLGAFMRQYEMPSMVQHDIFSFYRHYLMENSAGAEELLRDLPPKLNERINQHVNIYLLRRGPLFKNASQELLEALGMCLTVEMFLPGEEIVRYGDVGHEMFILVHGVVAVTNQKGELLAKLYNKDVFGEMALLHDTVRRATIRAITACNTMKLEKKDFDCVMASFPDFHEELKKVGGRRV